MGDRITELVWLVSADFNHLPTQHLFHTRGLAIESAMAMARYVLADRADLLGDALSGIIGLPEAGGQVDFEDAIGSYVIISPLVCRNAPWVASA